MSIQQASCIYCRSKTTHSESKAKMQSMKETAANVGASAKAGIEKTKASVQEKMDKMSAHDPMQKEMATQKKEERKAQAELNKQEAREHNAAAKQSAAIGVTGGNPGYTTGPDTRNHSSTGTTGYTGYPTGTDPHSNSTTGAPGYPTGTHQTSAMPGQGTGQPYGGMVEEGVVRTHPSGLPGDTTGHNTNVEGAAPGHQGVGTRGAFR